MFDIFSTREVALALYALLILIIIFWGKKTRIAAINVIKCACTTKLVIPFVILMVYSGAIVYGLTYLPFWKWVYVKDIVIWVLFTGVACCYSAIQHGEEEHYFRKILTDNLKLTVLIEFFVGTFTFSFAKELILQPLLAFIVLLQVVSGTKEEWRLTKKFLDFSMAIISITILIFTVKAAMGSYADINPIDTIVSFCIPIVFSVLFIPCAYVLALVAKYELLYMRMGFKEPKDWKVRWKRHWKVFFTCGLSYRKVCKFHDEYVRQLYVRITDEDFYKIIDNFKESY